MNKTTTINGLKKSDFEKVVDGKQTGLYILTNKSGMEVSVTNFGGKVVTLHVPDKNKKLTDVVLGHPSIDEYLKSEEAYFGALIGRVGNRIAKGKFTVGGKEYQVALNNAPNNLHAGPKGFNVVVWDANQLNDTTLELTYLSPDGDQGFPGNLKTVVTYQLTDDGSNTLQIFYKATTDKDTIVNLTHHSYFNLSGAGGGNIGDHILTINADAYTPTDEGQIPTGVLAPVANTPFDFTTPQAIGSRIDTPDNAQIAIGKGYDHNWVLRSSTGTGSILAAKVVSPVTGITMEVYTTEPGLQLYTGNWMSGKLVGKENKLYPHRSAFCLETQHFPDAINHTSFAPIVLQPGKTYTTTTSYNFSV